MAKRKKQAHARRTGAAASARSLPPKKSPGAGARKMIPAMGREGFGGRQLGLIALAVLPAVIAFIYGKYLEFNLKDAFDGSLNIFTAHALLEGKRLLVEVFPSARPGTLMVNTVGVALFGYSELGPKIIQMVMQAAALGLMFYTLRRLYGLLPAAAGLFLGAFYLSCPPFAKFGNVKEQFMIACMIAAGCAFMLRYLSGKRWWLLLAGGAAVNTWYFKPTGITVIVAMLVWLTVRLIRRRSEWRAIGADTMWLFMGAGLGLLPLTTFYAWQGKGMWLLIQFPAGLVAAVLLLYGVYRLVRIIAAYPGWRTMNRKLIYGGLGMATAALAGCSIYFALKGEGQLGYYLRDVFFIGYPWRLVRRIGFVWDNMWATLDQSGGYVGGSRAASTFTAQYVDVMMHYRSFVIPIGMSLLAIFWRLGDMIGEFRKGRAAARSDGGGQESDVKPETAPAKEEAAPAERFVLLMGVWWVLDMLFVWISPRGYVQYYLPLNGSAALLTAYALYRCRRAPAGFAVLLGVWILIDLLMAWPRPGESFPFIAFNPAAQVGPYWKGFFLRLISAAIGVAVLVVVSKPYQRSIQGVLLLLICVGMFFGWNTGNLSSFAKRKDEIQSNRQGSVNPWEYVGEYIRNNSGPEEGLYVWGWIPGIYVEAERSCPAKFPAYSDMHTDSPELVRDKIKRLVKELTAGEPRFIVDSQKIHFPYYAHPNFNLWMSSVSEEQYLQKVEELTLGYLTHPERPGGPFPQTTAEELAQIERQRHQAMLPLRKFVMENYRPVKLPVQVNMVVFRRVR